MNRPTALISYSHDSPEHEQRVLELCNRLRERGVDAFVDQFLTGAPAEGWPLWMERQIEERDFTLMVCTEIYRQRFMEDQPGVAGRGVVWEARILRNLLYEDSQRHSRIVPLIFGPEGRAFVPVVFRGHYYDVSDDGGFESLLRHLLREPGAQAGDLGALGAQGSRWSAFERPWVLPDAMRTRYFTGREDLLALLRRQLVERHRAALCGLGGVGKTQTAIEYATRHRGDYPDGVFWVNAETTSGLTGGFVDIGQALQLSSAASSDQERIVRAVLEWLNGTGRWLLVLDNVDDRRIIVPFVPQRGSGHVLITSRESVFQEFGIARALDVVDLDGDEAVRFLATRTARELDASQARAAADLAAEVGNLPLALEQAAAYITETGASFHDYVTAFRKRRVTLLERASGLVSHEGVAVTWSANFEAVEHASPAAADVLRVSAFLSPDALPFELFLKGASALGDAVTAALPDPEDTLAMNELLRSMTRYSLVRSDAHLQTFSVHRLVQEIVRDGLSEEERRAFAARTVDALSAVYPPLEYANWTKIARVLPHVMAAVRWIDEYSIASRSAGYVLHVAGGTLWHWGRYAEAQAVLERAVAIREKLYGPDHEDVAISMNDLAVSLAEQGRYDEAKPLYERALVTLERALGPDHFHVARFTNNLANVYANRGEYAEAVPMFERAIETWQRALGPEDPGVAISMANLATVYSLQGRYMEAAPMQERALAIWERALGPDHPNVAFSLANLADIRVGEGRYAEALAFSERALAIRERALGPDHHEVAQALSYLANVHVHLGDFERALSLYERSREIAERTVGAEHQTMAVSLFGLADVSAARGAFDEAHALYERALAIWERALGPDHYQAARALNGLANVERLRGSVAEAQRLGERALSIVERAYGADHPLAAPILIGLASAAEAQGRNAEAIALVARALAIKSRSFASDHPEIAELRGRLDGLRAS